MAYDSERGVTVLFGGIVTAGQNGETWEFDGTNWTQKFPATSPSARALPSMAYDSARHVSVLFGGAEISGTSTVTFDDTWEWDGFDWTRKNPAVSPSIRAAHGMAFDSKRGATVLFGGLFINSAMEVAILGDTWEWDGTSWTQKFSNAAPAESAAEGLCFDNSRNVTVLFGGLIDLTSLASDDTFEWDGSDWAPKLPTAPPPARYLQAMAFDSVHGVSVVFGGVDSTFTQQSDTWEWDGTTWRKRTPATAPSARGGASAVFDSKRGVTVLFGGNDNTNTLLNDTWEWTGPGPTITQQPVSESVALGQSASFTVVGGGGLPLTFQWRKNGTALTDGGGISGALTSTLTINPTNSTSGGSYDVEVTNTCGTIISRAVTLDTCKPSSAADDCNNNGIADACDIAANPALDANGNGVLDSCETGGTGGGSPAGQTAPCGVCGGGAAGMMPLALIALCIWPRRRARPSADHSDRS